MRLPDAWSPARLAGTAALVVVPILVLGTPTGPVRAEDVVGKLEVSLPSTAAPLPKGAYLSPLPNGYLPIRPPKVRLGEELVVILRGETVPEAPPVGCTHEMKNGAPTPSAWALRRGQALHFENRDGVPYQLYADSVPAFDATQTAPGKVREVALPAERAVLTFRDKLYGHVQGAVHVLDGLLACATVGAAGTFRLSQVPPGDYRLEVLYRAEVLGSVSVRVVVGKPTLLEPLTVAIPATASRDDQASEGAP